MAVKIDENLCGHIQDCPVQGLCIKLCEQGASGSAFGNG